MRIYDYLIFILGGCAISISTAGISESVKIAAASENVDVIAVACIGVVLCVFGIFCGVRVIVLSITPLHEDNRGSDE